METLAGNIASFESYFYAHPFIVLCVIIWSVVWKGIALWKSAQLSQKYWFVSILVFNTFGLLEIGYLFFVAKKYKVETQVV